MIFFLLSQCKNSHTWDNTNSNAHYYSFGILCIFESLHAGNRLEEQKLTLFADLMLRRPRSQTLLLLLVPPLLMLEQICNTLRFLAYFRYSIENRIPDFGNNN